MKKSILSLALAVLMVMTLFTVGAFADGKTVSDVAELNSALEAAQDGDTIVLEAGTYDVGALRVERAVNFKGAGIGQTVIVGSINYYCDQPAENVKDITVEDLTVISPENNTTTQQAIWWGYNGAGSLSGLNLNVKNCKVVDYLFAIGVNSSAKNCELNVENLALENVWCGANVSEGAGNKVVTYEIAAGSSVDYEIQVFGATGAVNSNCYYRSYETCVNDPTRANPDLNNNNEMPSIANGDWPAAAILNGKYYGTIQAAVSAATSGDVITVLPGTHKLADDETITINKQITIRGAGESTVISGSGTTDYGLGLFTFNAGSEGSAIEDLTINYTASGAQRSAVYFNYGFEGSADNVTKIKNVHFKGADSLENIMSQKAIAIGSTYIDGGYIEISGCTIENFAYGMYFNAAHDLAITGNTINGTKYNGINIAGDGNIACENINIAGNTLTNIAAANYDSDLYSSGISIGQNSSDIDIADNAINMLNGKPGIYFVPKADGTPAGYVVTILDGKTVIDQIAVSSDNNTIILPDAPKNSGYIFLGWRCGDATYKAGETVTVNSDMTFTAVWGNLPDVDPEEPEEPEVPDFPFYDVNIRDWYYDAVKYVYNKGLMDGIDTHEFAPNATLTRAMVWTIIARAEGVDTTGGASWYAKAQEWVVAKGISDGENPSAAITRQELVTMLYRLAGEPTVSGSITAPDAASVSAWASDAMVWAMNIGLIEGDENGAVTPTATATRAQAAAIFMRYIEA